MTLIVFMSHWSHSPFVIRSNPECWVDEDVVRKLMSYTWEKSRLHYVWSLFISLKKGVRALQEYSTLSLVHIFRGTRVCACVSSHTRWRHANLSITLKKINRQIQAFPFFFLFFFAWSISRGWRSKHARSPPVLPLRWRSRADRWDCLPSGLVPRTLTGWARPCQHQQKKKKGKKAMRYLPSWDGVCTAGIFYIHWE